METLCRPSLPNALKTWRLLSPNSVSACLCLSAFSLVFNNRNACSVEVKEGDLKMEEYPISLPVKVLGGF